MNKNEKLKLAVNDAVDSFWAKIVEHYPEIKSGDLPPEVVHEHNQICKAAVKIWLEYNL